MAPPRLGRHSLVTKGQRECLDSLLMVHCPSRWPFAWLQIFRPLSWHHSLRARHTCRSQVRLAMAIGIAFATCDHYPAIRANHCEELRGVLSGRFGAKGRMRGLVVGVGCSFCCHPYFCKRWFLLFIVLSLLNPLARDWIDFHVSLVFQIFKAIIDGISRYCQAIDLVMLFRAGAPGVFTNSGGRKAGRQPCHPAPFHQFTMSKSPEWVGHLAYPSRRSLSRLPIGFALGDLV
jgi:hypothetical protein